MRRKRKKNFSSCRFFGKAVGHGRKTSTDSSTKSQGDTIYCNGYPRVKYRMKKHGTDNCTGIFNFFLRREIPYTNADSVV